MKRLYFALLGIASLFSCSSGTKSPGSNTFTLDTFPKEWINVEQKENSWIIFEPCDAVTPEFKISRENGKNVFMVMSGQAADPYNLEKLEQNADGSVTLSVQYKGDSEIFTFNFSKTSSGNIWLVKTPDNAESYYMEKQHSTGLKKVVQPCRECWEEADCAEMEKSK